MWGMSRNAKGLQNTHNAGPYTFIPTEQPTPGAENNAFESNQANFLFFVWGNGTLYAKTVNPYNPILQQNFGVPIAGLGGLVTGQLVHIPLDSNDGDDTQNF